MSFAASLRQMVQRLIRQHGESASLIRVAVTGGSSGTTTQTPTTYTFRAACVRRGKSLESAGGSATLREIARGGRVLAGDEEAFIAAADLAIEPKPSDVFLWGSDRRRVVDAETVSDGNGAGVRVDILYRVGLTA